MYDKYLIQPGDTLKKIAEKFNTNPSVIMELNNIAFQDEVREGREIIVPGSKEKYFEYYTIESGDTIYGIARRYNINPELLSLLNGLENSDYIYPNEEILIPKSNYSYYVTAEGDTLDIVANKFKTTKNDIIRENETIYLLPSQLIVKKTR